jgi:hypothetical protein
VRTYVRVVQVAVRSVWKDRGRHVYMYRLRKRKGRVRTAVPCIPLPRK